MNKKRRTRLQKAFSESERLTKEVTEMKAKAEKVASDIEDLANEIEMLYDDEQGAHDNLPDSIQWSETGDTMQNIADALDEAKCYLEDAASSINEALNQ